MGENTPEPFIGHCPTNLSSINTSKLSTSDDLQKALDRFENEFSNSVLNFTIEAEVRDYVRQQLSEQINGEISLYGSVLELPNNYKRPYARGMVQSTSTDVVRSEVNIGGSSSFPSNPVDGLIKMEDGEKNSSQSKRLDIAVFKEGTTKHPVFSHSDVQYEVPDGGHSTDSEGIEVAIAGGSKFFPPEAVDIAIEIKYVKDKTTVSLANDNYWEKIRSDIDKLAALRSAVKETTTGQSNLPESHLVVVTNYDPFRLAGHRPEGTVEKERNEIPNNSSNSYPKRLIKLTELCYEKGVQLWIYYPNKIYPE